jgi:hypothetical protein
MRPRDTPAASGFLGVVCYFLCVGAGWFTDLCMMWLRTSHSSEIKVHLESLKVRPLAASHKPVTVQYLQCIS